MNILSDVHIQLEIASYSKSIRTKSTFKINVNFITSRVYYEIKIRLKRFGH